MSGINAVKTYEYNGETYRKRSACDAEIGFLLASIATAGVAGCFSHVGKPFQKQMLKEQVNNPQYKQALYKALSESGLQDKGVFVVNAQLTDGDMVLLHSNKPNEIRDLAEKLGKNAYYSPSGKFVKLNTEKAAVSGFHELGHALNHLNSKLGRLLQKCRQPGCTVAGLMGLVALFSREKPKGAPRNPWDFLQDNCGKIAFAAMLPTVAEEAMASYKGIKLAKKSGLDKTLIKNLRKIYSKALMTYGATAVCAGMTTYVASKITEKFTRPKLVKNDYM